MANALQFDGRRFALRLSDTQQASSCLTDPSIGNLICVLPEASLARLNERMQQYVRRRNVPIETQILLDLTAAPREPRVLTRSIAALSSRTATGSAQVPRSLLVLAHALRADAAGDPLDRLRALDHALHEARASASSPTARFNAAMMLGEAGLIREAREAWRTFLSVESDPAWRREGELRNATLVVEAWSILPQDSVAAGGFARKNPQRARELALDSVLPAWGRAVLADSVAAAAQRLSLARALGNGLIESTGERSVMDAVAWLEAAAADANRTREAARGHALFGRARQLFGAGDHGKAAELFRQAAAHFDAADNPFEAWPRLYLAVLAIYDGRSDMARAELEQLAPAVPETADALTAMVKRAMGLAESRAGRYAAALARHRESLELFEIGGEEHNVAASRNLMAEIRLLLGDAHRAWDELLAVLDQIGRRAADVSLQNALHVAGTEASGLRLYAAAAAFHAEGVRVAEETGRAHDLPEALHRYARTLLAAGQIDSAIAAIERADAALAEVADEQLRSRLLAESRETRALALLDGDPRAAIDYAAQVVSYYERDGLASRLIEPYIIQARAHLALRDVAAAADAFDNALAVFEHSLADLRDPVQRASLVQRALPATAGLTALQLRAGESGRALATHSRLPALVYPGRRVRWQRRKPGADEATLVYAVLQDSIALWTITHTDTSARWIPDAGRVLQLAGDAEAAILAGDTSAYRVLRELHDRIVAPAALSESVRRVTFVPDGGLHRIPFRALIDSAGHHLVERLTVRTAATANGAHAPWEFDAMAGAQALLVGVPAPGGTALPTLRAVGAEIGELAGLYERSEALEGSAATPSKFLAGIGRRNVVHFAGHALPSGTQPFTARLVLTPEGERGGTVLASEIAALDLRHVDLVVLAACATAEPGSDRGGAFTSLGGAFTGAGAGAVVGSLWPVDDQATADLLVDFHTRLRTLGVAEALAAAQRARIGTMQLRSWAAFDVRQ